MKKYGIQGSTIILVLGLAYLFSQSGTGLVSADQSGGLPNVEQRVATLEAQISTMQQATDNEIAALKERIAQAEEKLAFVSVEGKQMYISGANLHIRNGLGATNGNPDDPYYGPRVVNGLGNLTIGYNAIRELEDDDRSGSHNLILGDGNNYSSYGGLVAGDSNAISGPHAKVIGGFANKASAYGATVSAGSFNEAKGVYSSVLGGSFNSAIGSNATVSGGRDNQAKADDSSVSGGLSRIAPFLHNWAAGGLAENN